MSQFCYKHKLPLPDLESCLHYPRFANQYSSLFSVIGPLDHAIGTQQASKDGTTEYIGLTSAFLKANAQSILSTLWQIDELSSTWLIVRFYQAYLQGNSPAQALAIAQP
jgi:CHAT domain